jgi:hypothetical protein
VAVSNRGDPTPANFEPAIADGPEVRAEYAPCLSRPDTTTDDSEEACRRSVLVVAELLSVKPDNVRDDLGKPIPRHPYGLTSEKSMHLGHCYGTARLENLLNWKMPVATLCSM